MRGYAAIGLFNTKNECNIGGALRAAHCYNAGMVAIQGKRYRRTSTDTTAAFHSIPLLHGDLHELIPMNCVPVAVELKPNARLLTNYIHPERAFYIFGPEDGSVSNEVLSWCRDVIFVPTICCMNLAACVNVVLYDRLSKGDSL